MRIGVCVLPEHAAAEAARIFARVEELGFAHGWTYDHLTWANTPDVPWHSTTVTLAIAAQATHDIAIGTWVSSPNFRHPVTWARDLLSLQELSGGRVVCASGAGGSPDDGALQEPLSGKDRTRRFHEFTRLLRRSLREDPIDHSGDFFEAHGVRNVVATTFAPPPLLVAANGPKGVRLAAEVGDGWATTGVGSPDLDDWWASVARLAEAYAAAGGTGPRCLSIDAAPAYSLSSREFLHSQLDRAEELGFTDVVLHWPRPEDPYEGEIGVLEEAATRSTGRWDVTAS
ncbi:LLM class flavin-dependent oxidoreductase [Mariniluteicoccus endophyticus]